MFHIYISVLCLASNINACWDLMFLKTVQCLFLHVHRIIVSQDLTSCWEGIRWHVPMKSLWGLARWNASVLKMIRNILFSFSNLYVPRTFHRYMSGLWFVWNMNTGWDLMCLKTEWYNSCVCMFVDCKIISSQGLTSCLKRISWCVPMRSPLGLTLWFAYVS